MSIKKKKKMNRISGNEDISLSFFSKTRLHVSFFQFSCLYFLYLSLTQDVFIWFQYFFSSFNFFKQSSNEHLYKLIFFYISFVLQKKQNKINLYNKYSYRHKDKCLLQSKNALKLQEFGFKRNMASTWKKGNT